MIIDCFTFFNELDLLEVRLHELINDVDYFVLVEASKTQSYIDKPFFFEKNKERYEQFLKKIIHVKIDTYPQFERAWGLENYQRNCIKIGLKNITNLKKTDIVLISDLDELPSKKAINFIKNENITSGSFAFDFYAYYLNLKAKRKWIGTCFTTAEMLDTYTPQHFRNTKDNVRCITQPEMGWHLSWLGGAKRVWEKSFSCIEPLDKTTIPPLHIFEQQFKDLVKRNTFIHIENLNQTGEPFFITDNENYPSFITNNIDKFKQYFI